MLRDVFSPSFEAIYVNDADTYQQIDKYVNLIAPESKDIVKLYDKDAPILTTSVSQGKSNRRSAKLFLSAQVLT